LEKIDAARGAAFVGQFQQRVFLTVDLTVFEDSEYLLGPYFNMLDVQ